MNKFLSRSPQDVAWRMKQMHANNAIEGVVADKKLSAAVRSWEAAGVPDEEQIARLVSLAKNSSLVAA